MLAFTGEPEDPHVVDSLRCRSASVGAARRERRRANRRKRCSQRSSPEPTGWLPGLTDERVAEPTNFSLTTAASARARSDACGASP